MRLLVSVRDASEARAALAGGAEIIDAKEPGAGALGPVAAAMLREIHAAVPAAIPCSAALGDVTSPADVARALGAVDVPLSFVKLGFRGITDPMQVAAVLTAAVAAARGRPGAPQIVAVAYADQAHMQSLAPAAFPALVRAAGVAGLLVDTGGKDGGDLFAHESPDALFALAQQLGEGGAFLALGGSLTLSRFPLALSTGAAIVGVRGAACTGGRNGIVEETRVRQLSDGLKGSFVPRPLVSL